MPKLSPAFPMRLRLLALLSLPLAACGTPDVGRVVVAPCPAPPMPPPALLASPPIPDFRTRLLDFFSTKPSGPTISPFLPPPATTTP